LRIQQDLAPLLNCFLSRIAAGSIKSRAGPFRRYRRPAVISPQSRRSLRTILPTHALFDAQRRPADFDSRRTHQPQKRKIGEFSLVPYVSSNTCPALRSRRRHRSVYENAGKQLAGEISRCAVNHYAVKPAAITLRAASPYSTPVLHFRHVIARACLGWTRPAGIRMRNRRKAGQLHRSCPGDCYLHHGLAPACESRPLVFQMGYIVIVNQNPAGLPDLRVLAPHIIRPAPPLARSHNKPAAGR